HTSAALKCGVQLDLLTGALCGLDLADGRASDHRLGVQHAALPKGSLRLADLGFYDLDVLAALSAQEVYWLSKLEPTALITDQSGRCSSLLAFVQALGAGATADTTCATGGGRPTAAAHPQECSRQGCYTECGGVGAGGLDAVADQY